MPAALLAVLGQAVASSTLVAFYVTAVAAAALIAAAMFAYVDTVDHLNVVTGAVLGLTSLAAALVMLDAAVSFPGALSAGSSGGPGVLSSAGARADRAGTGRRVRAAPARTPRRRARTAAARADLALAIYM